MKEPEIIRKNGDTFARELLQKVPLYTPEWLPEDETDPGIGLVRAYANLLDITIRRLNMVPRRQFLSFLESLNFTLASPQPARAALTFRLSDGTKEAVLVPRHSLASAQDSSGQQVTFQTQVNLLAAPSRILDVFSVTGRTAPGGSFLCDAIFRHSGIIDGTCSSQIFSSGEESGDLQEHALYLGDTGIFSATGDEIFQLVITGNNLAPLKDAVEWFYLAEEEPSGREKEPQIHRRSLGPEFIQGDDTGWVIRFEPKKIGIIGLPAIAPGIKTRWITCRVKPGSIAAVRDSVIGSISINVTRMSDSQIRPDLSFSNTDPLDIRNCSSSNPLYPFGYRPQINDCWYIASETAFSRKGAEVTLTLDYTPGSSSLPQESSRPVLSWEYWDGESWQLLDTGKSGREFNFCQDTGMEKITIPSFPEVKKTRVNGKEQYWIRVRLIKGNYGTGLALQVVSPVSSNPSDFRYTMGGRDYTPPSVTSISLACTGEESVLAPAYIFTKNNLDVNPWAYGIPPFAALPDRHPSVYFCFDKPLPRGETSFFIAADESREFPGSFRPVIAWEYLAAGNLWNKTAFIDETCGLTRSGMVRIVISGPMHGTAMFGIKEDRFWIRAVNTDDRYACPAPPAAGLCPGPGPGEGVPESPGLATIPGTGTFREGEPFMVPNLTGIFPNSVWAAQSWIIEDEPVGSGSGEPNGVFGILHRPVLEETVRVDELQVLTEKEMDSLERSGLGKRVTDIDGVTTSFWVTWAPVDDLYTSGPRDRHYQVDRTSGILIFGDGRQGKIPPAGRNNIVISYTTGGGTRGNLPPAAIKKMHSAVAYVDKVTNTQRSLGGIDAESTDGLIVRAPNVLKNRNRAIAEGDYTILARESSPEVARVKVLSNIRLSQNEDPLSFRGYSHETGYMTVIIIPESGDILPAASLGLIESVRAYLRERCPAIVTVEVIRPVYIRADISAVLVTEDADMIPVIEKTARDSVTAFLHPLTGNSHRNGWETGTVPCLSDIYAQLSSIEGVAYVGSVVMKLGSDKSTRVLVVTDTSGNITLPGFVQVCAGTCSIACRMPGKEGA